MNSERADERRTHGTAVNGHGRPIVVLGAIDAAPLVALREAAADIGAPVVSHRSGPLATLGAYPLVFVVSMQNGAAFETCTKIRRDPRFALVPIIALADARGGLSFTELFHAGGDNIVAPHDSAMLARRLRLLCARQAPRESMLPGVDGLAVIAGESPVWRCTVARAFANAGLGTKFVVTAEGVVEAARGAKTVIVAEDLNPRGPQAVLADARRAGCEASWVIVAAPRRIAEISAAVSALGRVAVVDAFAPPENALFASNELGASSSNQRAAMRLLYGTSVAFRSAGRDEEDDIGFTYNISAHGLFVRTLAPLESDEDAWLELCAPRSSRRVRLVGRVAWRRCFGPNEGATVPAGFGVHIVDGLASDLERWQEGCAQLERDEARVRSLRPAKRQTYVPSLIARATV